MLNLIKSRKNKEGGSKGNKRSGSKSEKTGRNRNEKNRNNIGKGNVVTATNPINTASTESKNTNAVLNDPTVQQLYHHYYSIAEGGGPSSEVETVRENPHTLPSDSHLLPNRLVNANNAKKGLQYDLEVPIDQSFPPSTNETKDSSVSIQQNIGSISDLTKTAGDLKTTGSNKPSNRTGGRSVDKNSNIMQEAMERPSSRSSMVGGSKRTNQPKLGTGGVGSTVPGGKHWMQQPQNTYLFEDDPGIMSEVETSSTRFRRTSSSGRDSKYSASPSNSGASQLGAPHPSTGLRHPRTSPNQNIAANNQNHPMSYLSPNLGMFTDEDPGIMSEAETASTTRGGSKRSSGSSGGSSSHRSRVSIPSMGSNSLSHNNKPQNPANSQTRSVQFRYPIVSHQYPGSVGSHNHSATGNSLFDEDPGIMSEAETSSTPGRRRGQLLRGNGSGGSAVHPQHHTHHHITHNKHDSDLLPVVRTPSKTLERPLGIVFLIYRGETKRALLPNEITSIITVKVRKLIIQLRKSMFPKPQRINFKISYMMIIGLFVEIKFNSSHNDLFIFV